MTSDSVFLRYSSDDRPKYKILYQWSPVGILLGTKLVPETPKQNPRLLTNYQEVEEDIIMTIIELEKNYKTYIGGNSPFRSEQEVRRAPLGYQIGYQHVIAPCYLFSQARNTDKYENTQTRS